MFRAMTRRGMLGMVLAAGVTQPVDAARCISKGGKCGRDANRACCGELVCRKKRCSRVQGPVPSPSPTPPPGGGDARTSPIGTNLGVVSDWSGSRPFADMMKSARPWFSGTAETWEDGRTLDLAADGSVRSLRNGQVARSVLFTARPADPGLSRAVLHVRWRGTGTLTYGNVDVLDQEAQHDTVRLREVVDADSDIILIIVLSETDAADPLREVTVTMEGGICTSDPFTAVAGARDCAAGEYADFAADPEVARFTPQFLADLRGYGSLRFMDWAQTNNSPQVTAQDRPLVRDQFWSTDRGVPLEIMADLCTVLGTDAWLTLPHRLDDDAARAWGTVFGSRLRSGLGVTVEYSNEVWNGIFEQTEWVKQRGLERGFDQPEGDAYTGMVRFYALRATEVQAQFVAGFGDAARVTRVVSTQAVVPYFTEQILGFRDTASKIDLMAIAPYFGQSVATASEARAFRDLGVDGVFRWLREGGVSQISYGSLPEIADVVAAQVAAAESFGVPLGSYEGGQHFLAFGEASSPQLDAIFDAVNRDPRMADIYQEYLAAWRAATGTRLHHFTDCGVWSAYGRWGAREYPGQPLDDAPKAAGLMAFAAEVQGA